jgi:lysophospholipase L1-like esterase
MRGFQSKLAAITATAVAGIALAERLVGAITPSESSRAAAGNTVIGFGDSVAAGYGLSRAAAWSPQHVKERYGGGGARCSATLQAYPCVLARRLGDNVSASRNYAIQGATSKDVLDVEIPRALNDMRKASTRARISAVTLTTGADDIGFSQCLEEEFVRETTVAWEARSTIFR